MGKEKNEFVTAITNMEEDFAQWYTDIVRNADLADYSSVKGCMIIRPYGYAIWESIQRQLDKSFKETGHENVYMPMFIPESLLEKEKDHIEGFAPEVAWVTHGGNERLEERLCVRPTSETLFCDHFSNIVKSYRDLPKLYNQWCSVVRWEKTTRPFLRSREFLWQEGHTIHATGKEAEEETIQMLDIYAELFEDFLSIPVVKGAKTEKEKFAGAEDTYTIEALMHDGKALQSATSHYFGDGFARAFNIQYTDKNNELQYVHQTSWGSTTRIIGAIIMAHGDNRGLVLPPKLAPIQVVIVPIAQHKEGVLDKALELKQSLAKLDVRVHMDDRDAYTVGYKFNDWEMKGVPIRMEIGPKDIENNQAVLVRRDTGEKVIVKLDEVEVQIKKMLEDIQTALFNKSLKHREERTNVAKNMEDFANILETKTGFVKAMWCGSRECEETIKEKTGASSRCIPFQQETIDSKCICCGQKAEKMVYFAKAY